MKGCVDWQDRKWERSTPLDFQGPALWSTDPAVYAKKNLVADKQLGTSFCNGSPEQEKCWKDKYANPVCLNDNRKCSPGDLGKPFTLGSHLDMLHESPLCMGIAWEKENAYWVFDGCGGSQAQADKSGHPISGHGENFELLASNLAAVEEELERKNCEDLGDIVRYDFRVDHGAGFDDHCDGLIERYAIRQVRRADGVPSHMLLWQGQLFIADSGNHRVARLDPAKAGSRGPYSEEPLSERVNKACTVVWEMENARREIVSTYLDLGEAGTPSGIALYPASALAPNIKGTHGDEVLIVGDNARSMLLFISLTKTPDAPGELLGVVDLSGSIEPGKPGIVPDEPAKPGGLMGLAVHPKTSVIYVADALGHKIWSVKLLPR